MAPFAPMAFFDLVLRGGTLIDGTAVRLPFRGWYLPDGQDMENHGAQPDVPVDQGVEGHAARPPHLHDAVGAQQGE